MTSGTPHPHDSTQFPQHDGPVYTGTGYPQPGSSHRPSGPVPADGEERTWMMLAHLSAPIAALVSLGWLSFLGPLAIWLLKKNSSPEVRQVAAGAFNFNLSFWIMNTLAWVLLLTLIASPIALLIWVVIVPVAIVAHILGAVRASQGRVFRYPFQLPVLR